MKNRLIVMWLIAAIGVAVFLAQAAFLRPEWGRLSDQAAANLYVGSECTFKDGGDENKCELAIESCEQWFWRSTCIEDFHYTECTKVTSDIVQPDGEFSFANIHLAAS